MQSRTFSTPLVLCLLGVGVAACTDKETPPSTTVASVQDKSAEAPPRSENRSTVTRGPLPADVGDRVLFAYDSSLLSPEAQRTLQRQAAWLKGAPPGVLTIEGHADERGTREYNLALGDRRAGAVRDYLVTQGVPADRLRTISYGKERPQIAGHGEAAWAQNRRAVSLPQ
jgi:peptidoglycan-associated lipoprotein